MLQILHPSNLGFSLIEVLLSVALITILVTTGTPVYFSFLQNDQNNNSIFLIQKNIKNAQLLAQSSRYGLDHGIYITSSKIVLFVGSSYVSRTTSYDEETTLDGVTNVTGDTEIVFPKMIGTLSSSKNISINFVNGKNTNITVNKLGVVN